LSVHLICVGQVKGYVKENTLM